jgi:hypothetical protein
LLKADVTLLEVKKLGQTDLEKPVICGKICHEKWENQTDHKLWQA